MPDMPKHGGVRRIMKNLTTETVFALEKGDDVSFPFMSPRGHLTHIRVQVDRTRFGNQVVVRGDEPFLTFSESANSLIILPKHHVHAE